MNKFQKYNQTEHGKQVRAEWYANNKEKKSTYSKADYQAKKEQYHARNSRWSQKTKEAFVEMYGGKCACCGETDLGFLTIEHRE